MYRSKADPELAQCGHASPCLTEKQSLNVNIQSLQYVFYSLPSLQKYRIHVKGYQNNPQTPRILPLGFEIPGSSTASNLVSDHQIIQ